MDEHLAFLQSQAAYVEPEVFMLDYADIQYPRLLPVVTTADPWAGQITYYSQDGTGQAEFLATHGTDFPFVEVSRAQHDVRIENLGIGYEYNYFELGLAMRLGNNLTTDRAEMARRAYEEKLDDIALNGVPEMGWDGLLDHDQVPTKSAAANGQWSNSNVDGLAMAKDVNDLLGDVWSDSKQVYLADTIAMSPSRFNLAATTPIGDNADHVVMDWLKQNNTYTMVTGQPLMFTTLRQLETAGEGGTQRMIAYQRDPRVLRYHIPMPLQFLPAQQVLTRYCVPGVFRVAGLEIRLPNAIRYFDGY